MIGWARRNPLKRTGAIVGGMLATLTTAGPAMAGQPKVPEDNHFLTVQELIDLVAFLRAPKVGTK
jgi:hypothetical protein